MALFRCQSGNGGGGGKSGSVTLTAGQELQIPTGLSNIKRFILYCANYTYNQLVFDEAFFDFDIVQNMYGTSAHNGENGGYATAKSIGTSSGNERLITIKSVSGGTVTVVAPSNSNFVGTFYWFAE